MRIYDLAKEIGQKLNIEVKSAKLADEFKSMPQFAAIHDTIKSHASTIDDEHAQLMLEIYQKRYGLGGTQAPKTGSGPVVNKVTPPLPPRPVPPPPRPTVAPPPRPAPIQAGAPRPIAPIPAVRRPVPIQPLGKPAAPVAPQAPQAPAAPQPAVAKVVAPAAPQTPAPPAAHEVRPVAPAPTSAPRPVAPTPGTPRPAAPPPSGPRPVAPQAPGAPAPRAGAPVAPPRPPAGTHPGRVVPPQRPGVPGAPPQRPGQPSAQAPQARAPQQPGQPARPGQPPQQGGRPQGGAPHGGGQGVRPVQPKSQKFRPSGLATELKSSSGTTGVSAAPDLERLNKAAAGAAGQPTAPAMPKFSADSPFVKPPPRKVEPKPAREGREGRPAGAGEAHDRTRPPREGAPDRTADKGRMAKKGAKDAPVEILQVPEIGVMKLKPKRHRGAAEKGRGRDEVVVEEAGKPAKGGVKGAKGAKGVKKPAPRPSKVYGDADEFRYPIKPSGKRTKAPIPERRKEEAPKPAGPVVLTGPVTVGEFAEKLGVPISDIIKRAFMKGQAITINQLINMELAEEIAFDMEIDLSVQLEGDESDIADYRNIEDRDEDLEPRPPVVTIMGHVDHGKTTLLDYYRRSQVVEGEFGGITQHIGAYHVTTSRGEIVFLDTPGHEAFTAMRARGVQATDIVVLVVSADDGVMPQTIEAINHARAAGVPIIVAINKIDLPQANSERVRTELLQQSVVPTSLGGEVEFVEISAKKGINMDNLLEIISLQAEVMELKANPNRPAEGIVIESHVDPLRGSVATILVQKGTIKVGQFFVVGQQSGRVRAMLDDHGRPMNEARPGTPVELIGLSGAPEVGETLLVMEDERKAREIAERREQRRRLLDLGTTRHVTLEGLHDMITEGQVKELNVILKADVQGSVEAITQSMEKLSTAEVRIRILHSGTGPVNESDVNLALASSAIVIGFNIRPEPGAAELAAREGIEIKLYRIIYELLEDLEKALTGMLEKRYEEQIKGRIEVRQVFRVSRVGVVAGCMVVSGEVSRSSQARVVRDGTVVYEGKIASLRRHKDDVAKVAQGFECGIMLEKFQDVKEGDVIEVYSMQEIPSELSRAQ